MVPGYSEVSVIVAPHTLRYGGLLFKGAELAIWICCSRLLIINLLNDTDWNN
jgi:hypothetical protein